MAHSNGRFMMILTETSTVPSNYSRESDRRSPGAQIVLKYAL